MVLRRRRMEGFTVNTAILVKEMKVFGEGK